MIEIHDIWKSYGKLTVLAGVNLSIGEGEMVAVVGPSGAGKTTLLQIAGTLDRPDRGSIRYEGKELTGLNDKKLSEFRNRNIGFVFQFHQLLPEFSAQENVALPAMISGESRRHAMSEAERLLQMLGLGERLRHKPGEMSGGERQRTAIARALINKPRVVFADEPTGSLDSRNRQEIQDIFTRLRDELGQTFVMVTHDPSLALIADRVVTMADGRIDTVSNVMTGVEHEEPQTNGQEADRPEI
ncbi:MAG: ABC transporter ATP-binding protein [Bacteroides sp.]|nr:ABC transporter ATP-binding protein [Bacteroides sp.]